MGNGQGSGGNVMAAVCSFFLPGLGQLVQGRMLSAVLWFLGTGLLWVVSFGFLGWLGHVLACYNAAVWKGPR